MTKLKKQIEQLRECLADLQSGRLRITDGVGNIDEKAHADHVANITYVLSAYDDFVRSRDHVRSSSLAASDPK